jgi:hypothetical protein
MRHFLEIYGTEQKISEKFISLQFFRSCEKKKDITPTKL